MNLKFIFRSINVFAFVVFLTLGAESAYAYTCPNYEFNQNLVKGMTNHDVSVIQEILNLDRRTMVAYSGPGSRGQETNLFGAATRDSLKRFQALFIEYIGIADGKFNTSTRLVMNSVCKGPFFTGKSKGVYDLATSTSQTSAKDTTPPIIGIASVSTTTIDIPFRAYIAANEPIKAPNLSGLIISGATASDMRKTSPTTFTFLVTPNQDNRSKITLQFEADAILDMAGNKNLTASNEWTIYIVAPNSADNNQANSTTTVPDLPGLDLPGINSNSLPSTTDCSKVTVSIYDYSNPCYGKSPITMDSSAAGSGLGSGSGGGGDSGGGGGGGGGGMGQIMQMLQGLMKGLTGLGGLGGGASGGGGGGGNESDGKMGPDIPCGCNADITTFYTPIKGSECAGAVIRTGVTGNTTYVGRCTAGPKYCGKRPRMGPLDPCQDALPPHDAACCGIFVNSMNMPIVGKLAPSPTGMGQN